MLTIEQAKTHKGYLLHMTGKDSKGKPTRVKVTGKCKLWKREPERFELPVKMGLYTAGYVTNTSACDWCLPELWEAEHVLFAGVKQ